MTDGQKSNSMLLNMSLIYTASGRLVKRGSMCGNFGKLDPLNNSSSTNTL